MGGGLGISRDWDRLENILHSTSPWIKQLSHGDLIEITIIKSATSMHPITQKYLLFFNFICKSDRQ